METLTREEIEQFIRLADKIKFPVPSEVFFAWSRNFYVNAMELAIMRTVNDKRELFLSVRSPDDPYYANMWHMPGAVCIPGKTFAEIVSDCIFQETGYTLREKLVPKTFVKHWDNTDETRGHANQFLYLIDLPPDEAYTLRDGQFFPLNKLPSPMVKSHIRMTNWLREHFST